MGTGRLVLMGLWACALTACSSESADVGAFGVAADAGDEGSGRSVADDAATTFESGASVDATADTVSPDAGKDAQVDAAVEAAGEASVQDDGGAKLDASPEASLEASTVDASNDAMADAEPPAAACSDSGRYTIAGDEVTDTTTGRVWSRSVTLQVKKLPANVACSSRGPMWRLPSKTELEGLVRIESGCLPTIDQSAFPNTPATFTNQHDDSFWTDTYGTLPGGSYYLVRFHNGTTIQGAVSATANVRCVR
jgi:hypothetical protein